MSLVQVDIETIVVGGGPMASLVVLKPRPSEDEADPEPLPIRLGVTEAASIGMGIENPFSSRPMTHDLMRSLLHRLGASLRSAIITRVEGTTFYACLNLRSADGSNLSVDSRPSDAIALALRCKAPIYVDETVLDTASCPNFDAVMRDEAQRNLDEFHEFLETVAPEDFSQDDCHPAE